ncbi:hypothetical protein [Streptomyces sp. KL116D]|uniref:hypothetical protein n=1 Tax=Streptomyces sp. KL116D TaxID=3045152 RepID=UPI0035568ED9
MAACAEQGAQARAIDVDYASHSAQMDQCARRTRRRHKGVEARPRAGGVLLDADRSPMRGEELDASYWYRNLR